MKILLRLSVVLLCCSVESAQSDSWPQFRGPNASGVASGSQKLPASIGPDRNLLWKVPLPPGHSSPVVHGDRVFVTAVEDESLLTLGLHRDTGEVLWRAEAEYGKLEEIHRDGSHAQSSPATDGQRVVSFFGSGGLFCYDRNGQLLWRRPMGPFKNGFGAASSPIIVGDRVVLNQDHDVDSFLMALDKGSGKTLWKTGRPEFPRGFSTPVSLEVNGKIQIVVSGTLRIAAYNPDTGKELWTVRGLSRIVNTTPIVGEEGVVFSATWSPGAEPGEREKLQSFPEVAGQFDGNRNGRLELEELPEGSLKARFNQFDRDKDDQLTRAEYEGMKRIFETVENVALAIRPGGTGDVTKSHVLWRQNRYLPYVPSPIHYRGYLFWVKRGGIVASLDPETGKTLKVGRVAGQSRYFSSPVAGDGKIYLLSERGELSVISAEPQWRQLSQADFQEEAYATPAISGGRIYLRTAGHLYCFGLPEAAAGVQR
ncbi:MAG: PQQ-binding-like beta-propeller repeat protein [Acidobacteria bacterium]|nr:PQQ-binding-like beta-propeller repeat protein [Acidobacteriota bacterium]